MAKCLVTGASGFIGTHLVRALLARGDAVTCLVRRSSALEGLRALPVRMVQADVAEPSSLSTVLAQEDVDVVYHLAGLIRGINLASLLRVNEQGVRNVVEACAKKTTPPVFVLVSSMAALGPANGKPLEGDEPPRPVSNYGRSKRAGELAATRWAAELPLTIVRPAIVLGEGDLFTVQWFRVIARYGVHWVPTLREHHYSLIHVSDVCDILIRAATQGRRVAPPHNESAPAGQGCYLAGRGEDPSMSELGRMLAAALGRQRVLVVRVPQTLTWLYALGSELACQALRRAPEIGLDKMREIAAGSWTCSPSTVESELGFQPQTPFAEQLRQTADWYRSHGWL